jgi:hypothetical protein
VSRRLALLAAAPLATLAFAGTAAASTAPSPATAPPPQGVAVEGITLCHEGFYIELVSRREAERSHGVVVLIGANNYGIVTGRPC